MFVCVFCSVHGIYCLQLERFLCRECGKVKCSCGESSISVQLDREPPGDTCKEVIEKHVEPKIDAIEFRNPTGFTRQYSRSEQSKSYSQTPISHKPLESTEKSYTNENGKLRRSFIVRSREGLENFLNFSATRKGQGQGKEKQISQQF